MREVFATPPRPPARWAVQLAVAWLLLCLIGLGLDIIRAPTLHALFPRSAAQQEGAAAAAGVPALQAEAVQHKLLRCAIYNGVRFHSDVAAGMAWAFQEAGCGVTMYLRHVAHDSVRAVVRPWYQGAIRNSTDMLAEAAQYDLIVMVTFPEPEFAGTQAALLRRQHSPPPHQQLQLVTHNPHRLLSGCTAAAHPWLLDTLGEQLVGWQPALPQQQPQQQQQPNQLQRIHLLTLAPCVSTFTSAMLEAWAARRREPHSNASASDGGNEHGAQARQRAAVPWMAPLVPWTPSAPAAASSRRDVPAGRARHLCIQGSIDPRRRDYAGVFAAAAHPAVLAQLRARNESLLLVGSDTGAELDVPPPLQPYVRVAADLPYDDYYATLSSCRAVLAAFPSDAYITHKASSTPAVVLQVGAPLLAEGSVLAAYSYLSPAAAYNYSRPGTSGPPDPAAAGAAVGREAAARTAQQWQAFRGACRKSDSGMGAGQALRRLLAAAGSGKETSTGSSSSTGSVRSRSRAGLASAAGGTQELPPPGSYAAALLAAFEDDTNQAAHAAAWRVKHEVMRHNVQLARQFLAGAAPL